MSQPGIVFVCALNAVRSPMAEAFYNTLGQGAAVSCGVRPASLPDGHMINVMNEVELDLSAFEPKSLHDLDTQPCHVVCLTEDVAAEARAFARQHSAKFELWPIPEPRAGRGDHEARLAEYRKVRDEIRTRIAAFISESGYQNR